MRPIAFVAAAAVVLVGPLSAQTHADSVKVRNDCRLAAQVLTKGVPDPQRDWALQTIGLCGRAAVPALVGEWSRATDHRAELEQLVAASRAFVSPELVAALFATLEQPGRTLDARVAALLVLITYADPSIVPGFSDFMGDANDLLAHHYGAIDHPAPAVGREDLAEPPAVRLRATLETIAGGDPNPGMRVAARVALKNPPLRPF